jgi:rubrerythrin
MGFTTFNDALDFAINREKEAVAFYQDLQAMAKFASQKELMGEFEAMEMGHVSLLEGVKTNQEPARLKQPVPADLHLDDFLVTSAPIADMTYQDILIVAIKREKKAADLYTNLQSDTDDPVLLDVFGRLVVEEENHKHFFEKLYDRDIQSAN